MNTLKTLILLAFSLLAGLQLTAQQSAVDKLYDKYVGKEGVTSISLSSDMFKLAAGLSQANQDKDGKEMTDMINQINGMKIIVLKDTLMLSRKNFHADIQKLIDTKSFAELMRIDEKDSQVKFYTAKTNEGVYREVLMIAKSLDETVVMSFTGQIKPETLGKLANEMNNGGIVKF